MASHLEKLPPELLLQIAEYIPRPSDLKALCLASKTLQTCALPPLYHTVDLDSALWWAPENDKGLLQIGNPGLPFVQRLIVHASGDVENCEAETKFFRMFLAMLPKNTLRTVVCLTLKLDEPTVFSLLVQQQKVELLALGPISGNFANLLQRHNFTWNSLKGLCIPMTFGSDDLTAYQSIIEHAKNLSALQIRCNKQLRPSGSSMYLALDYAGGDLLQDKLLTHVKAEDSSSKLRLDELQMHNLKIGPKTAGIFDLARLRSICIWECQDATLLFSALATAITDNGCALREFTFYSYPFECKPVETLLRSFTGLKKLHLVAYDTTGINDDKFDLKALDGHKASLQDVMIGCYNIDFDDDDVPSLDLDVGIFATFPNLVHLAIPMTPITIPEPTAQSLAEYRTLAKSVLSLPHLCTLRILTWPTVNENTFVEHEGQDLILDNLHRKCFSRDLNSFFSKNLSHLVPRASVVIYDSISGNLTSDSVTYLHELEPVYYVGEKRVDSFNNIRTCTTKMGLATAKYIQPAIDGLFY